MLSISFLKFIIWSIFIVISKKFAKRMNSSHSKNRLKTWWRKMTLLLNEKFWVFSFVFSPRVGFKWNCRWNDKLDIFLSLTFKETKNKNSQFWITFLKQKKINIIQNDNYIFFKSRIHYNSGQNEKEIISFFHA